MLDQHWKSTEPFYLPGQGIKGRTCLLLIHGFTGNPGDFRRLALHLHKQGYSVQAIRLPGHGTTPEEMRETRWEDWWHHTLNSYDLLAGPAAYRKIIPIGYSMGGMLALKLSLVRETAGVVSLAAPVFLQDRRIRIAGIAKYIKRYIHKQPVISDYLLVERGAYAKTPTACIDSLYKQMRIFKRELPLVSTPVFVGQGLLDATVRPESADYIHRTISSQQKMIRYYSGVSHAIMADATKRVEVYQDMLAFVDGLQTRDSVAVMDKKRLEDIQLGNELVLPKMV